MGLMLLSLSYFNTTVCVGSSLKDISESVEQYIFQYNCLCRFEVTKYHIVSGIAPFQYNCLCRFEQNTHSIL